jgi:VIT1/CCC1 family predicted Fe2+/Mn2+ transporter
MRWIFTFLDRYLEPGEQLGQVLFGLMMALIITLGAGSILSDGDDESTREILLGVLGGNFAWGVIQGWMYVIDCIYERSRVARVIRTIKESDNSERALALLQDELDDQMEPVTSAEGRTHLYADVYASAKNNGLPWHGVKRHDLYGAMVVFVLVMVGIAPAAAALLLIDNRWVAVRVANLLSVIALFLTGFRWASLTNTNRWKAGFGIMLGGGVMVAIAEVLGG